MTKDPIEIEPASTTETMEPTSRLRFGKIHSIEFNVKVREIGVVSRQHMSKLLAYYKEEDEKGFGDDNYFSESDIAEPKYIQEQMDYTSASRSQAISMPSYANPQPYQNQSYRSQHHSPSYQDNTSSRAMTVKSKRR
jgi:hypothetical protein